MLSLVPLYEKSLYNFLARGEPGGTTLISITTIIITTTTHNQPTKKWDFITHFCSSLFLSQRLLYYYYLSPFCLCCVHASISLIFQPKKKGQKKYYTILYKKERTCKIINIYIFCLHIFLI